MSLPIATLGDPHTHGGAIIEGSTDVLTNGKPTARFGDKIVCSKHGVQPIVEGSIKTLTNGLPTVVLGCKAACGALILPTSQDSFSGK